MTTFTLESAAASNDGGGYYALQAACELSDGTVVIAYTPSGSINTIHVAWTTDWVTFTNITTALPQISANLPFGITCDSFDNLYVVGHTGGFPGVVALAKGTGHTWTVMAGSFTSSSTGVNSPASQGTPMVIPSGGTYPRIIVPWVRAGTNMETDIDCNNAITGNTYGVSAGTAGWGSSGYWNDICQDGAFATSGWVLSWDGGTWIYVTPWTSSGGTVTYGTTVSINGAVSGGGAPTIVRYASGYAAVLFWNGTDYSIATFSATAHLNTVAGVFSGYGALGGSGNYPVGPVLFAGPPGMNKAYALWFNNTTQQFLTWGVAFAAGVPTVDGAVTVQATMTNVTTAATPIVRALKQPAGVTQTLLTFAADAPTTYTLDGATMVFNNPPNAPTLSAPTNNATIDDTIIERFSWVFSDPDAGDSQSKFDLQYRVGTGAWTTVSGTTPNQYVDIAASTFTAGTTYEWQVRTYDSHGLVGPWSSSFFFTAQTPPATPTITAPTAGSTVAATATLTWSTPNQTDYQVRRVADLAGAADTSTVYWDSGDVVDASTRSRALTFDTNGRWEHVQVRVKYNGLWSTWADVRVDVSFVVPATPTLVATSTVATASIGIAITNPAPTGGQPTVTYHDLWRRVAGSANAIRVATLIAPGGSWTDYRPASGVAYEYQAISFGTNGTQAASAWTA